MQKELWSLGTGARSDKRTARDAADTFLVSVRVCSLLSGRLIGHKGLAV